MPQYDNTNKGVLFVNDKQGNPRRPDWRGNLNVNGVEFWISGWEKESRNGPMIQLNVEAKQAQDHQGGTKNPPAQRPASQVRQPAPRQESPPREAARPADDDLDDIPFNPVAHDNHLKNMLLATR
jgi:hypothetical protein